VVDGDIRVEVVDGDMKMCHMTHISISIVIKLEALSLREPSQANKLFPHRTLLSTTKHG